MPHCHILLILKGQHKPHIVGDYDKLICVELLDKDMFLDFYNIVIQSNIHGQHGPLIMKSPCMVEGRCKHHYPKIFSKTKILHEFGYPMKMHRDDGQFVEIKGKTYIVHGLYHTTFFVFKI